jgi:hypothetical protein
MTKNAVFHDGMSEVWLTEARLGKGVVFRTEKVLREKEIKAELRFRGSWLRAAVRGSRGPPRESKINITISSELEANHE